MTVLNGVDTRAFGRTAVINGGKQSRINGNYPYEYNKWRMVWNGYHFAPPDSGSVLYLPGIPGQGSTIQDFSFNFTDSAIDTDEELDATETGVNCDADATTAIPINSIIRVESELMLVTATGATLTVVRGYLGSIAATHATNQDIFRWLPNNGTITGATPVRLPSGLWVLDFDGIDDYVDCGNDSSLRFTTSPFAVGLWIKPSSVAGTPTFATHGVYGVDGWYFQRNVTALDFITNSGGGVAQISSTGAFLNTTNWFHLFAVRNGASVRIYSNGADITSVVGNHVNPVIAARTLKFGCYDDLSALYAGLMGRQRIFNRAASASEVANIFNQERHLFGV